MEQIMYLLNDHTGPASKTKYAKKGDAVNFLKVNDCMALVEKDKVKFWIRETELTSNENLIDNTIEVKQTTKNIAPKVATKKVIKIDNQQKLF